VRERPRAEAAIDALPARHHGEQRDRHLRPQAGEVGLGRERRRSRLLRRHERPPQRQPGDGQEGKQDHHQ
jgi:hypothetical protein